MDHNPIIFKHGDVYKTITENLLCPIKCDNCENKKCSEDWFLSPPRFTTIRVNSLLSSIEEVEDHARKSLVDEAVRREQEAPGVWRYPGVPELLVLDPWAPPSPPQPPPPREVVVDAACGAAVLRGANVFAPGVLAVPWGTQEGMEVSVYADTAGLCLRGLSVPFTGPGKAYVGSGVMTMSRKQLFQNDLHPKGVAVEVMWPASNVSSVTVTPHLGLLQNLPSVVCGRVLDPRPGDRVIDLCAAPGHKTTHLAALMHNQGVLVALDKIARKVETLRSLCQTMGANSVQAFTYDATKVVSHDATDDWAPPFLPGTFDRVLLDAPCSALGQRPQLGNRITRKQIASHPKLQKKLFHSAVQLVKPGGSLVYSTCSVTVEENEDIVSWALDRYPQMELVPAMPLIGGPASPKKKVNIQKLQYGQLWILDFHLTAQRDSSCGIETRTAQYHHHYLNLNLSLGDKSVFAVSRNDISLIACAIKARAGSLDLNYKLWMEGTNFNCSLCNLKSSLSESQQLMVQRFGPPVGPSPHLDTIGFFIAKFTKNS